MAEDKVEIEVGATTSDAEDKVKSLGDTIKESMDESAKAFEAFNLSVSDFGSELDSATTKAGEFGSELKDAVGGAGDSVSDSMGEAAKATSGFGAAGIIAGGAVAEGMEKASEATSGFGAITVAAGVAVEHLAEQLVEKLVDAVKESITAFSTLGEELGHMQRRLGGTGESLSALKVGLESVGISTGQFEAVALRLGLILEKNGDKFAAAGIKIKDSATGDLLPSDQIIQNLMTHMDQFSAGSARNAEAAALGLGRSWRMMADFVEMTTPRMKEAKDVAEQFGLTLTNTDLAATTEFNRQLNLLKTAFEGFYVTIGRQVDPILTQMAKTFREDLLPVYTKFKDFLLESNIASNVITAMGAMIDVLKAFGSVIGDVFSAVGSAINALSSGENKTAMDMFRDALNAVTVLALGLGNAFTLTAIIIEASIERIGIRMQQLKGILKAANPQELVAAWKKGEAELDANFEMTMKHMADVAAANLAKIKAVLAGGYSPSSSPPAPATGGDKSPPRSTPSGVGKGDTRLAVWKDELKQMLEAEQDYFKTSLDEDEAFWQKKLALVTGHSKADLALRRAINSELYNIHKQQAQQARQLDQEEMAYRKQQTESDLSLHKEYLSEEQAASDRDYAHSLITTKEYYANKLAIETEGVNASIAAKRKELVENAAQIPVDAREALKFEMQRAKIEGDINVLLAQQANLVRTNTSAENDALAALEALKIERIKESSLHEYAMKEETLNKFKVLGRITDLEELTALQDLKAKEYEAEVKAQQAIIDLGNLTVEQKQAAYDKLAAMAEKYAEAVQKSSTAIAQAQADQIAKFLDPITQAFDTTVNGIIQGTTTIKDGFKNMCNSIVLEFNKMTVKMLADWIKTQLQMQMESNTGIGGWFGQLLGAGGGTAGSAVSSAGAGTSVPIDFSPFAVPLATGTNFVPHDMLAVVHRGEAVVPAQYNRGQSGQSSQVINNNFNVSGAVDLTTRQQLANMVAQTLAVARGRNG